MIRTSICAVAPGIKLRVEGYGHLAPWEGT